MKIKLENDRHDQINIAILFYFSVYITLLMIGLFNLSYKGIPWLTFASFKSDDSPWLPTGVEYIPIYQNHYFGDFYLPFQFVNEANPYFPENPFNLIFPLGQLPFQLLGFMTPGFAYLAFLFTSVIIFFISLNLILGISQQLKTYEKYFYSFISIACSFPIVTAVDRGAYVLLVAAALAFVIGYLIKFELNIKSEIFIALGLAFLISAKIYLLSLIVIIWFFKSQRLAILTIIFFTFCNFLLSFTFGGPRIVISQLLFAFQTGSASYDPNLLSGSLSFSGLIFNSMNLLKITNEVPVEILGFLPGFLYLLFTVLICKFAAFHFNLIIIVSMSFFQYITPVSYVYTGVWATISAALLINYYLSISNSDENKLIFVLAMGILSQLIPIHLFENYKLVIPFLWLLTIFFIYSMSLNHLWKNRFLKVNSK